MAGQAVTDRGRMNFAFDLRRVFIGVAGQAEFVGSGRDQLDVGDVAIDADFVAGHAAHRHRRMYKLSLGFIFVAGEAGGGVGLGVERNRMLGGRNPTHRNRQRQNEDERLNRKSEPGGSVG